MAKRNDNYTDGFMGRRRENITVNGMNSDRIYLKNLNQLRANAVTRFAYEGAPLTTDMLVFENAMLNRGTAAILRPKGSDVLLSLPYIITAGFRNCYGYPSKIIGLTRNTWFDRVKTNEFVVFYDDALGAGNFGNGCSTTWEIIESYAQLLWECEMAFTLNLMHQNKPFILPVTNDNKFSFSNFWNMFQDFRPYMMLEKGSKIEEELKTIDLRVNFIGEQLLACRRVIWDLAMNALGYAGGTTKKERQLANELIMNQNCDAAQANNRLLPRIEGCNKVNRIFKGVGGFEGDMSVNLRDVPLYDAPPLEMQTREDDNDAV